MEESSYMGNSEYPTCAFWQVADLKTVSSCMSENGFLVYVRAVEGSFRYNLCLCPTSVDCVHCRYMCVCVVTKHLEGCQT